MTAKLLLLCLPLALMALAMRPRAAARPPAADPARLEAHVRALAEDFVPRDAEHPENLDQAAAYIREQLERAGGRVEDQPYQAFGTTYRNVIARFGPDTGGRVVVGAHYDAAGPLPGADDNASGVAGLLELARLLGQSNPRTGVELVAFTLEEPPAFGSRQMGSAVHASGLRRQGVPLRGMICLEMIGYFSDEPGSQRFPAPFLRFFYPNRGNFITVAGKTGQGGFTRRVRRAMEKGASPLNVRSITAPESLPGMSLSDHRNYWAEGYEAVMITDTAFFRNDNYHTEMDTPETLDYQRMSQVVEGVHAAVMALAR